MNLLWNCRRSRLVNSALECKDRVFRRDWHSSWKTADPLRILFCGSDEFSTASLRRLSEEQRKDPAFIASIDVVCKEGKRSGRGQKKIRHVPIKQVAQDLSLALHQIPTFTGWDPPLSNDLPINLIIAVSFGLRIPKRILEIAKYGGLNVHPSLLPDLRGAAPLQHTLMQGRTNSGVTLQTLHPELFDHGTILAQRKFAIPNKGDCNLAQLLTYAAPHAADLLVDGLKERLFDPPLSAEPPIPSSETPLAPSKASKITAADACIDWQTWSARRIVDTQRAIGPLWQVINTTLDKPRRIKLHGLSIAQNCCHNPGTPGRFEILAWGNRNYGQRDLRRYSLLPEWCYWHGKSNDASPVQVSQEGARKDEFDDMDAFIKGINKNTILPGMWTCDGRFMCVKSITIEGGPKTQPILWAFRKLQKDLKWSGVDSTHVPSIEDKHESLK